MIALETVEKKCWGEHGEYGPYRVQGDGLPYFSDVIWDFLERNGLGVEAFAHIYGKLVRRNGEPYTKSRIYQMLRDNSFPTDPHRRWILARLLHIPPLLLGLASLDDLLTKQEEEAGKAEKTRTTRPVTAENISTKRFSLEEYRQILATYWQQHRETTVHGATDDIRGRLRRLEKEILYGEISTKKHGIPLLCGYLMLLANIASDQECYNTSIIYLNQAYALAKEKALYQLQTSILCRRGWAFKERGEQCKRRGDIDAALRDLRFAARDFQEAITFEKKAYPGVNGTVILSLGKVEAELAQTPYDFRQAIKKLDRAEAFVGKKNDEEEIHFIQLNEERYHLDRAAAYLAAPIKIAQSPGDARRELRNAMAATTLPYPRRRQAYGTILKAQSYYLEGDYEEATKTAREALVIAQDINSTINIARIATLYDALKVTDYGKSSIDVAALEIELLKAQQPDLFL
ncbi:MAG TPA: hypothetical protein VKV37_12840 [Ktedonobacteraceae bacterium]|jgi:tetratricopeptide (TPR) repeat protein|nr:hypothetical protein [Ktedonobacteraceae bacterium]